MAGNGMSAIFKITAGAAALGFMAIGLCWWIAPQFAATQMGMELLGGLGLSTQLADLAAFFLTLGSAILLGLVRANRVWLYPPIMLLGFAVCGRLVAWRFHGADLAIHMIAVEIVVIAILWINATSIATNTN